MTIKPCEETWRFLFHHELYSIKSFHMKNRGAILLKMKYLKNETESEVEKFWNGKSKF